MTAVNPNREHYPALDGLRGIAILLVVFFHNFGFIDYFYFGWLGVDLFFVLSGFLITEILLKSLGNPGFLSNFFIRRMLRIFPLYYLFLIIFLLVLPSVSSLKESMNYYANNQWWFWLYIQNWLYVINPPESNNLLLHLWSLAVEEQFYIIWPFVILLIRNKKWLLGLVIALLIAVMLTRSLLWVTNTEGLQYFNLYIFTRIDGICIGCALALIRNLNPNFVRNYTAIIVSFIAALNFAFFFLNRMNDFSFPYFPFIGYTTFAILFAILVDECIVNKSGFLSRIFQNPILRFFGKISYGFYIIHWPVYKLSYDGLVSWLDNFIIHNDFLVSIISSLLATCLAILLSIISFYFFEKHFLLLKNKLKS